MLLPSAGLSNKIDHGKNTKVRPHSKELESAHVYQTSRVMHQFWSGCTFIAYIESRN